MQRVSNMQYSRWATRQRTTAATTGTWSSTSRPALTHTEVSNTHHQCLVEAKGQRGQSAAEASRALGTPPSTSHTPAPIPGTCLRQDGQGWWCSEDAASVWVIPGEAGKLLRLLQNINKFTTLLKIMFYVVHVDYTLEKFQCKYIQSHMDSSFGPSNAMWFECLHLGVKTALRALIF